MKRSKNPKYIQIKNLLENRFRAEKYNPGQRLPTEFDLMDELSVSRTTVRQAIGELERAGLIERKHGSGTYFRGFGKYPDKASAGLVGLVNFFFTDYIYPEIIQGIEETIFQSGYSLALANSRESIDKEISSVERLIEQGVKGLILEPSRNLQIRNDHPLLKLIADIDIPVVTTHWGISATKASTVTIDDIQAGYEATRYLMDRGHRDIAILFKEDVQAGHDRYQGYRNALAEGGIEYNAEYTLRFDNNAERVELRQGYLLTAKLIQKSAKRPTAIFYFNDNTAIQGYSAIKDAGFDIPNDISVISFDNYRNTDLLNPPLTTYEHPKYDLGKWAAKILLEEMDGSRPSLPMKLIFEPVLVERKSVKDIS